MAGKKWTRRLIAVVLTLVMACSLVVPSFAAQEDGWDSTLKIAVMSDTHYLSPTMIYAGEDYTNDLNSDRKMLSESNAIIDKVLEAVAQDAPDVLLISGDLTKDGELECHEGMAQKLQALQQKLPGLKIYVAPGNHDNRNENGKNFNTADGNAVPATRTNPEDFKRAYDFIYSDETVIATFTPPEGKEAGSLSYVARPAEGYTIIAIDTCRYSADNTESGKDEHETSGAISAELEQWVIEQTKGAKARGDVVIGLEHHGLVEHFSMESTLMPMYLVEGYDRIAAEYADAGMSVVFTGHMHANDIAVLTTESGNTLYDIETGSALTYPSPMRFVEVRKNAQNVIMNVSTKTHIGPITFTNPETGKVETISDLTAYGQERGFSADMLSNVVGSYVGSFLGKFVKVDGFLVNTIVGNIDKIVRDLCAIPVAEEKNLLDFVNFIYQTHLAGDEPEVWPEWVNTGVSRIESGELLDEVLHVVVKDAFGDSAADAVKFNGLFTSIVKKQINDFLLDVVNSFGHDVNYREDNDTLLVLQGSRSAVTTIPVSSESGSVNANAYILDGTATVFLTENQLRTVAPAGSNSVVTVDASALPASRVVLTGRSVAAAEANAAVSSLNMALPNGAVALDQAALASVDQNRDVAVSLEAVTLTAAQRRALGKQADTAALASAKVTVGGEPAEDFGGGKLTVTVPCTLKAGESTADLTGWTVSETGEIEAVGVSYDAAAACCTFVTDHTATLAAAHFPFTDVDGTSWYYSPVAYTYNNSLFEGMTPTTFEPQTTMSRAMLVTVLWRAEGCPSAPRATFGDLEYDWYRAAVDWAAAYDIVEGYSAEEFGPADPVTREQMATILYRYGAFKGYDVSESESFESFRDADAVHDWAASSVSWAVGAGLMQGYNNKLMPLNGATRAEVSALLQRFIEHFAVN